MESMLTSTVMRDLIERVRPSVAEIWVRTPERWEKNGSGFAISSDGLIATCHHVINAWSQVAVSFGGGDRHGSTLERVRPNCDLAILKIDAEVRPLALGTFDQIEVGREVVWCGYPLYSWLLSFHRGMISHVGEIPLSTGGGNAQGLQLDGTVNRGNSGGPIINPDDGSVVGIITSSLGSIDDDLREALRAAKATRGMIRMTQHGKTLDPAEMLVRVVRDMQRHMQLGVGYGISVDYLSALRGEP